MSRDTLGVVAVSFFIGVAGLVLAPKEARAESQVDLTVTAVMAEPPAVYPGQKFAVGVRVKNNGPAATTKPCTVLLRVSQRYTDKNAPAGYVNETSEVSVSMPPLGALREWQWSSLGTWTPKAVPVRASQNSISVTVDSSNVVPESNETNNSAWTSYRLLGRDWYVSPMGSDASGTGSQGLPYATIERAMQSAKPGDHFYFPLFSGGYQPSIYEPVPPPPCPPDTIAYGCPPQDIPSDDDPLIRSVSYCTASFKSMADYKSFLDLGGSPSRLRCGIIVAGRPTEENALPLAAWIKSLVGLASEGYPIDRQSVIKIENWKFTEDPNEPSSIWGLTFRVGAKIKYRPKSP